MKNGSETYKNWLEPPVPLYVHVYVFNITNSDEFSKGSENLEVDEVGPFVYQETRSKNIYEELDSTITYEARNFYEFVPSMSVMKDDVSMTTVNVALLVSFSNAFDGYFQQQQKIFLYYRQPDNQL